MNTSFALPRKKRCRTRATSSIPRASPSAANDAEPASASDLGGMAYSQKRRFWRDTQILQCGKIPVREPWPLDDVTALIAELSGIRHGIKLLESGDVEPLVDGMRTAIRIAGPIRPVAREARNFRRLALERNVIGVIDGEGRSAHVGHDAVYLPVAQRVLKPVVRLAPEGQAPLIAENETVPRVEHRAAAFRG